MNLIFIEIYNMQSESHCSLGVDAITRSLHISRRHEPESRKNCVVALAI